MTSTQEQTRGKILVVDDEEPVGRLLEIWLTQNRYEVRRGTSFDQVCEWMAKQTFDLVTLDIMMPVVDGLQTLKWLREYHPETGVVMATALGEMDLIIEAMRLGAYSYLLKPFKMDMVTHEIARAMERQRLVAENRAYQQGLEQKVEEQTRELRAAYARLERQVKELEGRDRLVYSQMSISTYQEACMEVLEVVREVLAVEVAVLFRPEKAGARLVAVAGWTEEAQSSGVLGQVPTQEERALVAQAYRDKQPRFRASDGSAVPLMYQDTVLGVLWVWGVEGEEQKEERNTLWRLGQAAAPVLWSAQVKEQLDSGAVPVDELLNLR
ncbi:MAG: response regulator [Candidatus Latescibacteria bacterium]|nr:response regulator [Candidatus Latescibacterota bacterium]